MKINSTTGHTIDSDNLNDRDAAIFEALNDFYKVCEKYKVTMFGKVILNERKGVGDSFGVLYLPNDTEEIKIKEHMKLVASIADWIYKTSNGRFQVFDVSENDNADNNDNDEENPLK